MPKIDSRMAKRLAELASLVYESSEVIKTRYPDAHFLEKGDTQALLIREGDVDLLAFRGTEPTEWGDLKTDVDIVRVKYRLGALQAGKIHRGFKDALELVLEMIEEARRADPEQPIYVTGHSLGGALAVLWAASQSARPGRVAGVYTFGAPRVGSPAFAAGYDNLFKDKTFQFQNRLDKISRVPSRLRHVGHRLYFDADHELHWNPEYKFWRFVDPRANYLKRGVGPKAWIQDHAMTQYLQIVAAL